MWTLSQGFHLTIFPALVARVLFECVTCNFEMPSDILKDCIGHNFAGNSYGEYASSMPNLWISADPRM